MEGARIVAFRVKRLEPGREDPFVAVAIDEAMRRISVDADGSRLQHAEFILENGRRPHRDRAAANRFVEAAAHVRHIESNIHDAIAVLDQALAFGMLFGKRRVPNSLLSAPESPLAYSVELDSGEEKP